MARKKRKQTLLQKLTIKTLGFSMMAFCLFAWLSCLFYNHQDNAINIVSDAPIKNLLGKYGAITADYTLSGFGLITPIFLLIIFCWGHDLVKGLGFINAYSRILAFIWGISFGSTAFALIPSYWSFFDFGGIFGAFAASKLMTFLNHFNTFGYAKYILFLSCFSLSLLAFNYAIGITIKHWYRWIKTFCTIIAQIVLCIYIVIRKFVSLFNRHHFSSEERNEIKEKQNKKRRLKNDISKRIEPSFSEQSASLVDTDITPNTSEQAKPKTNTKTTSKTEKTSTKSKNNDGYVRPNINLLSRPQNQHTYNVNKEELENIAHELENTLEEFGIHGKIVKVRPGPVVTLYELEPAPGTKNARVIGLADDIARSMSAVAVRIALVPGSNTIGIELPNMSRDTVWLRDLFEDKEFSNSKNALNVVLGKDIGGKNTYADLAKMPHLLVAGTTGSGKSVGVNSMILSLLFRMSPDECKLIMIDPKMLEFSMYNGIPHLLTPVITDPAKAVIGLKWAVKEMEDRYRAMAQMNVRNITGYNQKVEELLKTGKPYIRTIQTGFDDEGKPIYEEQEVPLKPLPYIVIVVDEMADLMLVAGKEVEAAIQRLAQMARAAGLHLIMSTQRPSVDVITGTIKANFPTRISFQVTSKIDSRTILGEQGAEQLLGKGDMLYMPAGQRPIRVHGAFVKDEEVESIVEFIKSQKEPEYIEAVTQGELNEKDSGAVFDKGNFNGSGGKDEDLYAQAVDIIRNDKKASISYVQRRLRIGYNRAASLIDKMEEEGIVSAPDHTGKRQVIG